MEKPINTHGGSRANSGRKKGSKDTKPRAKGAGRTPTNLRSVDISNIGVQFDEPCTYHADLMEHGKCGECGAVWWDDYTVIARSNIKNDELDDEGNLFSVLAVVQIEGKEEKHLKRCSQYGGRK